VKVKQAIGRMVNSVMRPLDLEIRRIKTTSRHTLRGTLEQAKRMGFEPRTVIDIGAAIGTFELYETFPKARHILIDPLEENRPYLERIVSRLEDAEYIIAAAAERSGTLTLNVHRDLFASSLCSEYEGRDVDGTPRTVPAITLDEVCEERQLEGPYLIKVDVQGAELNVLAGADQVLKDTEYIVLEVCLMGFFIGGPQLYDVAAYMKERAFVVYDILDYAYRPLDGAMSQVDMAFVKESGRFRRDHSYATKVQREAIEARFFRDRNDL
jgi:FkbM family methyltransferase